LAARLVLCFKVFVPWKKENGGRIGLGQGMELTHAAAAVNGVPAGPGCPQPRAAAVGLPSGRRTGSPAVPAGAIGLSPARWLFLGGMLGFWWLGRGLQCNS